MSTKTGLELLREPFPPHQISLLPKPQKKKEEMDKLPKGKCKECGGWHATSSVIHLSYVGHAALTDRLLDADPNWFWEPLAVKDGMPVYDANGGLWIKLTVLGVTRLGYGHAGTKTGGDAVKEVIGDALRNAAMRFGAALDLWHKGELHVEEEEEPKAVIDRNQSPNKSVEQEILSDGMLPEVREGIRLEAKAIEGDFYTLSGKAAVARWLAFKKDAAEAEVDLCWSLLDSKVRSGIKKVGEAIAA